MATFEQEELYREAKAFAGSKAMAEVFGRLEARYIDDWRRTAPDASGDRDAAYYMVRAINDLRNELTALAAEPAVDRFNRRLKSV
jgi:hypothetical protein